MKKVLIIGLIITLNLVHLKAQDNGNAILLPEKEVFDAHKIKLTDTLKIKLKFKNDGSSPLIIENVKVNCSCTKVSFPKTPILPTQKNELEVEIVPNSKGRFIKELYIYSNSVNSPTLIRIKANVK